MLPSIFSRLKASAWSAMSGTVVTNSATCSTDQARMRAACSEHDWVTEHRDLHCDGGWLEEGGDTGASSRLEQDESLFIFLAGGLSLSGEVRSSGGLETVASLTLRPGGG